CIRMNARCISSLCDLIDSTPGFALRGVSKQMRSMPIDTFLNIGCALTRSKLDDSKVGEAVHVERIFCDDGFDLLSAFANDQDNPAISRDLSSRDQEIAGRIVLLQESDMRRHVPIDLLEIDLVNQFDHEHVRLLSRACDSRWSE